MGEIGWQAADAIRRTEPGVFGVAPEHGACGLGLVAGSESHDSNCHMPFNFFWTGVQRRTFNFRSGSQLRTGTATKRQNSNLLGVQFT